MEDAFEVFGERRNERLATISVTHLYDLRKQPVSTPPPGLDQDPARHHCHRRTAGAGI